MQFDSGRSTQNAQASPFTHVRFYASPGPEFHSPVHGGRVKSFHALLMVELMDSA